MFSGREFQGLHGMKIHKREVEKIRSGNRSTQLKYISSSMRVDRRTQSK